MPVQAEGQQTYSQVVMKLGSKRREMLHRRRTNEYAYTPRHDKVYILPAGVLSSFMCQGNGGGLRPIEARINTGKGEKGNGMDRHGNTPRSGSHNTRSPLPSRRSFDETRTMQCKGRSDGFYRPFFDFEATNLLDLSVRTSG